MPSNRGFDSRDSKSRLELIEAAYELLGEEGHPAITARRIADRARLKPQLVHYYFRSMEELVVAVFQRATASYYQLHDEALSSRYPLHALWKLNCNMPEAQRIPEFIALSRQYGALRDMMRQSGEAFRRLQIEAIERIAAGRGLGDPALSATGMAMLMATIARNIMMEKRVGMTLAHEDMRRFIEALLDRIEPVAAEERQPGLVSSAE